MTHEARRDGRRAIGAHSVAAMLAACALAVCGTGYAQNAPPPQTSSASEGNSVIMGSVTGPAGPEAGVWVIAEIGRAHV